ncbi:MAG: translational GTPase TypA [Oscillospiraceae bacterium]|nr:translational GTPase TypA [Oscillospiraceae bacterium]
MKNEKIRNIAIIAHVDHGKTTLVDAMLKQTGTFRVNEQVAERVMDSNDLERERGITILAKNTSLLYKDYKINIVDTPGHADFGGEVERSLSMVDGVLLLVDAFEGCMPQTRTVLKKALALHLVPIIVVNKIDRPAARPAQVLEEVYDLLIDLGATEEQLNVPVVYASGRDGTASLVPDKQDENLRVLFDLIIEKIPAPESEDLLPFQMMVSNIDFNEYTGRIAVGKITRGHICEKTMISVCRKSGAVDKYRLSSIYVFEGLKKKQVECAYSGDIVCLSGIPDINIGETVCDFDNPEPLPFVEIDQPVLSMFFSVNTSPFAGSEGQYVTSRHLRERLYRELESNISLKVEDTDTTDTLKVSGRGELHLSVLIENMRRQGFEFQVSKPTVIIKEIEGVKCEPYERLFVDTPDEYNGTVIDLISQRKGEMVSMAPISSGYTRIEFIITSRGLFGARSDLMTATKGNAIVNTEFEGYSPLKGALSARARGSLIAFENGTTTSYGMYNAQDRGTMFIPNQLNVYEGMVIGESNDSSDLVVNPCKKKHLTAVRSTGADEALRLVPPRVMTLEKCLEFIADDELLEVTPQSLRLRKKILSNDLRAKQRAKDKLGMANA